MSLCSFSRGTMGNFGFYPFEFSRWFLLLLLLLFAFPVFLLFFSALGLLLVALNSACQQQLCWPLNNDQCNNNCNNSNNNGKQNKKKKTHSGSNKQHCTNNNTFYCYQKGDGWSSCQSRRSSPLKGGWGIHCGGMGGKSGWWAWKGAVESSKHK